MSLKLVPKPQAYAKGGPVQGLSPFLSFINQLEGYKTKCKNLHWAAPKNNVHVRLDEFLDIISDYQDTVAEGIMGVLGIHLGPNDVSGISSTASTASQLVKEVKDSTLAYYSKIPDSPLYAGLKSECETFIQNVNKYDYLFSLTDSK